MAGENILWHAQEIGEIRTHLRTENNGLSSEEVERRKAEYGLNRLPPPKRRSAVRRLLEQFNNVLIYVLIVAGIIILFLQHWVDAAVIFSVVVINALVGFIQEGKAERALEEIQNMLPRQARVLRGGKRQMVAVEELVPGDIVYLESGEGVPADLRLFETRNLLINEAALTGESESVEKRPEPVAEKAVTGERFCIAHSGTTVSSGRGAGIVVTTGGRTEIGKINRLIAEAEQLTTPLLKEIGKLGRFLTGTILALCGLIFAVGYLWRGMSFGEIFLAAVGIAVAAIPEGLPAIITITLAIGVRKMARRNVIIRRLPAVETLGSVSVICSDKTGTLTRNEMTVTKILTASGTYDVTGIGYSPEGEILAAGEKVSMRESQHIPLARTILAGILCNDADLQHGEKGWCIEGDPTEGSLLPLALKAGLDRTQETKSFPRTDLLPFESERRCMATLHQEKERQIVFVKGAPETILQLCDRQLGPHGEEKLSADWNSRFSETASHGFRLLAAAYKEPETAEAGLEAEMGCGSFVFLGLFALIDPPREEVMRAVEECKTGGIQVKMITGDFPLTARSIGAKLGIGDGKTVLEGVQIEEISDAELPEFVERTDVFARSSPEHKIRLVRALQTTGETVAMTGDGVNDAPALKQANIGIAMGIKGTEVAQQASEMVLADDNFASIVAAVKEGRTVYDNIKKSILFILPTNGGEALVLVWAILFGLDLPITPVQILWVNMITAVTLALALAFEPGEADLMKRPPRETGKSLLDGFGIWRVLFVSVLLLIGVLTLYFWALRNHSLEFARTVSVNTLIFGEIFYLLNSRRFFASTLSLEGLFGNKHALAAIGVVLIAQMFYTYLPAMQFLFGSEALPFHVWLFMLAVGIGIYFLVELEKWVLRRFT